MMCTIISQGPFTIFHWIFVNNGNSSIPLFISYLSIRKKQTGEKEGTHHDDTLILPLCSILWHGGHVL